MITIVDYGVGNVQALANIYKRLEIPCLLAKSAAELAGASHVILPGVGAFDWAMARLQDSGMREALDDLVTVQQKPVLGICVGMQMMARGSDEGQLKGLGWFDAHVRRFDEAKFTSRTHLPHMGWNDVEPVRTDGLLCDLGSDARFYFLHSYYFAPNDPTDVLATTVYGERFACAVQRGNVHGAQFHPEKSHGWGIQLLKNFAGL
ncbi:MAG: imidazole glycerol phosphate synthase subunit HisH [Acidovorax sp.]|nr:imidazole glycerol phosphate synthase subunit HisH [Acidovorax sp.]